MYQARQDSDLKEEEDIILFIHKMSKACNKLLPLIKEHNSNNLKIIDITQLNNLPSQITSIPALILKNETLLLGKDVFDYFTNDKNVYFKSNDDDDELDNYQFDSDTMKKMSGPRREYDTNDIEKILEERANLVI